MKTRAAVAWEAGKPLEILEINLEGPRDGEVLIRNVATGVCHTDAYTLSGSDPEGISLLYLAMREVLWWWRSALESLQFPLEITSSHSIPQNVKSVNFALLGKQTSASQFEQLKDRV